MLNTRMVLIVGLMAGLGVPGATDVPVDFGPTKGVGWKTPRPPRAL